MKPFLSIIIASVLFIACGGNSNNVEDQKHIVKVRLLEDADQLNPVNSRNETAKIIADNMFQTLVNTDRRNYTIAPILAKARPEVFIDSLGRMIMDFEIKEQAVWPNGSEVTSKDVEFSVKVVKNPLTNCHARKPYLEFVSDIEIDAKNPKKFRVISDEPYHLGETAMDALYILPEYFYDEKGLMKSFEIRAFKSDSIKADTNIIEFARLFNSELFQREKFCGSGAYEFGKWQTNQKITIRKKTNWWGDQFMEDHMYFEAHPEEIQFIMIPDMNTAIAALKQGKIDVMRRISLREFVEILPNDPVITEKFELLSPAKFSYDYIGFNTKSDLLNDRGLRFALSQMVNVEQVIDKLCYGLAERTVGFIHPAKKRFYNEDLELHQFNLDKLNKDLDSLGWSDKNEQGIRQKMIDGKLKILSLTHIFPSSSLPRKNHAIVLKDYASKVGIEMNIVGLETSLFLQRLSQRDFDTFQSGWITGPGESDPKQIWHTESIESGSNYVGYGSSYSDSIIDELRITMDFDKRAQLYRDLQKDIYEEAPYVFMMCVNERLAISKKFSNIYGTAVRPGFWAASLRRNWLKN